MSRKPKHDVHKERAITLICKSVIDAPMEQIRKMLCLAVGHPPIFKMVGVIAHCARCNEIVAVPIGEMQNENMGLWSFQKPTPTDWLLIPYVMEKEPV